MKREYERLARQLGAYRPVNAQEACDRELMLAFLETGEHPFERSNCTAHFTASAWVTNRTHDRVLMIYHNIYRSWAWTGGHADGETDLCAVAWREAQEESGLGELRLVAEEPVSLEILTVNGHEKRGEYVPSHLHYNVTYLFEADESQPLRIKPDENAGVRWFSLQEALAASTEPWMVERVYQKVNCRLTEGGGYERSETRMEEKWFESIHYVIQKPRGFDPEKQYPCLLFLHGAGTRGTDLQPLIHHPFFERTAQLEEFPFVVVAPLCHEDTWLNLFEQLIRLAEHARSLPWVDAERFYCMGASMGGYGTWLLAEARPELFAAIAPICGGGVCWNAGRLKDVPVWAFHCAGDPCVMLSESENMVAWTNRFGGNARLTVYPLASHNAWDATYSNPEVYAWLLSHRNAQASAQAADLHNPKLYG